MRLGIMGGTFDPIHVGHLFIAEDARIRLNLDRVIFVPNGTPPHKTNDMLTSSAHRFEMTRLAVLDNAMFAVDDIEMNHEGPSYTVETLISLRARYPQAEFVYITGIDAIAEILTWRRHPEVIELATFVAATRPGFDVEALTRKLPDGYLRRIILMQSVGLDISSTEIRKRIGSGDTVRYLAPDAVLEYIELHRLYRCTTADHSDKENGESCE